MAKWRKLHSKTTESLDVNDMPDDFTRLLWVMLPLGLDRDGRGLDNASWVKAKIMPLRGDVLLGTIEQAMSWYAQRGMVQRYTVKGRAYFCVPSWVKYQGDTSKETASEYPAPSEFTQGLSGVSPEFSENSPEFRENSSETFQENSRSDSDSDSDADSDSDTDAFRGGAPSASIAEGPDESAQLEQDIREASAEFADLEHVESNLTRAFRVWGGSDLDKGGMIRAFADARLVTRRTAHKRKLEAPMAYLFTVLERAVT